GRGAARPHPRGGPGGPARRRGRGPRAQPPLPWQGLRHQRAQLPCRAAGGREAAAAGRPGHLRSRGGPRGRRAGQGRSRALRPPDRPRRAAPAGLGPRGRGRGRGDGAAGARDPCRAWHPGPLRRGLNPRPRGAAALDSHPMPIGAPHETRRLMSEDDSSYPPSPNGATDRPQEKRRSWFDRLSSALSGEPSNREDLVELLRDAHADGLIETDTLSMMEGAIAVSDLSVGDVMIPRSQMVMLPAEAPLDELLGLVVESGHSRFPVHGDDKDQILGILLAKDLLRGFANGRGKV